MLSEYDIEKAAELLVHDGVRKIVLFGSYARGEASDTSDVDFLVVEENILSKVQEIMRLRRSVRSLRLPLDVMVASEQEVNDWGAIPGTALYWALKEGKVLYEA
ncbi:MAG: nucleotidyltransferase domain-containing protein [Ghiorsea sp.]|nr:nucleotidyltransferase domain-containing protein [Ghiorsea sp.]